MSNTTPKGWKSFKLKDLGNIVTGNTPSKNNLAYYSSPDILWAKPSDFNELYPNINNTEEKLSNNAKNIVRIVPPKSVLMSCIGSIGKLAIAEQELTTNQQINAIIFNSNIIDYKFAFYALKYKKNQIINMASNTVVPIINKTQFGLIDIPVPTKIEEQREIVQVLDAMSDIIRLRKECIEHAQDLIPALFQEMFGNPLTNEKNLPIVRIDSVTKVVSGGTPSTQNPEYWDGDIIWLTPKDLSGYKSMYISKGERNITDLGYQKSSAQRMPKGSVLFTSRAPIGYVAIAEVDLCTNQGFKSFVPTEAIKSEYLYQLLKMSKEKIINMSSGATFKEISGSRIKELKIPIAPIELQEQFTEKVKEINSYIEEQEQELENANQMFQSLLHHAFTGELTKHKFRGEANA